ncbi:YczE/YyaS/YitT family protein [Bifidobacterium pseudocatenulatum]|jgi:uncharacterized membrane protein YczE|uniref:YczE/YyaS/YitT family protein n=1 Tax=Bifidobacterium pseudocatenulatum TaxID=28026 RepID=UPI000E412272|nr:DUF6198 family protein [Bifidobacterium pseudocatenulatum]MDB6517134.1 DUF6198 family protein [Bifidobacterium pseudocatenulatum]MDB6520210.1 DUF6198 family protein [Bifidobacterium pseudocatenulatum]RGJ09736.1 YitT family protein [Bifidobacterium pseudocatenulatum]RGJ16433.1 YitT family protein [Bifidobacterium pseudocatenulatum]RGL20877.1 YitT family protein [Bifidobacterium pseudocatenulatum]
MNNMPQRLVFFALGVVINSFGVALITLGNLGTSAISSVPYVCSLQFPMFSFGVTTFIWNILLILLQVVLLRRDFKPSQFLQIMVNVLFSAMIDVSMAILGVLHPTMLWEQFLCIGLGCVALAFGIVIELAPNVVVVPGEGVVRAIAKVSGVRVGTVKAVFDITLIIIAAVLSLIFFHGLRGVGIGTVISAVLVGPIINIVNRVFTFQHCIQALALSRDGR